MDCPRCPIRNVIWLRSCPFRDCPILAIQPNEDGTAYDGRVGPLWCALASAVLLAIVAYCAVTS